MSANPRSPDQAEASNRNHPGTRTRRCTACPAASSSPAPPPSRQPAANPLPGQLPRTAPFSCEAVQSILLRPSAASRSDGIASGQIYMGCLLRLGQHYICSSPWHLLPEPGHPHAPTPTPGRQANPSERHTGLFKSVSSKGVTPNRQILSSPTAHNKILIPTNQTTYRNK